MSYSSVVLADSPLVYYRLGDSSGATAADSSGNSRAGSYAGSPTLGVTGLVDDADTAVTLAAGSSQEVQSSSNAALSTANMMIEMLVKSTDAKQWIRDHTNAGGTGWFFDASGTNLAVRISGTTYTSTYASSNIKDGNAHHIVWGADGTTVYIYVDGTLRYSTARGATTVPTLPWHLGRNGTGTGSTNYTTGTFDEWAIYSSLSGARVAAHWAAVGTIISLPAATATGDAPAPTAELDVSIPAATATGDAPAPDLSQSLHVDLPAATATADAPAPLVEVRSRFSPYDLDANSSQALQVAVQITASLYADPIPVPPPSTRVEAQIRGRRVSLVMPAPTLDSNGRPT